MAKLTRRSPNLVEGFRSEFTKPEVVRKLGYLEHRGPELVNQLCDRCRYPLEADEDELDEICAVCPATKLLEFLE